MNELENAVSALDTAIEAIKNLGEGKRTGAMVRKLTIVKADLQGELAKASVMLTIPAGRKRTVKE